MTDTNDTVQLGGQGPSEDRTRTIDQWIRRVAPGVILFREGDQDRRVFVLVDGRVEILKGADVVAEVGVADTFIGEVSALTGKPRWATARVAQPSTLLVMEHVEEMFREGSEWGLRMARVLAKRLDGMNERFLRLQALLNETRRHYVDSDLVQTITDVFDGFEGET